MLNLLLLSINHVPWLVIDDIVGWISKLVYWLPNLSIYIHPLFKCDGISNFKFLIALTFCDYVRYPNMKH